MLLLFTEYERNKRLTSQQCTKPSWCMYSGGRQQVTYVSTDCDGDGFVDQYCRFPNGQVYAVLSKQNCKQFAFQPGSSPPTCASLKGKLKENRKVCTFPPIKFAWLKYSVTDNCEEDADCGYNGRHLTGLKTKCDKKSPTSYGIVELPFLAILGQKLPKSRADYRSKVWYKCK